VNKLLAVLVGTAFVAGTVGFAVAQTPSATDKKPGADTKMEKKDASAKKASTKTAVGTVKSASPDSIVVAGKEKGKDTEWTFAVDDKTKVKKAGKDTMAKDLAPGDKVTVRYMDHDGKATAMNVNVSGGAKKSAEKK
jgi:hypothetical protein